MGNVIGVDCSFATNRLVDRLYIAVKRDPEEQSLPVEREIARNPLFSAEGSTSPQGSGAYHLLSISAKNVDVACHVLSQYRQFVRRVALCGNKSASLMSSLEAMLPEAVIYELEHDACLHRGEEYCLWHSTVAVVKWEAPQDVQLLEVTDLRDHIRVSLHSGVAYHLCPHESDSPMLVGRSVIGLSALSALFNLFLVRSEGRDTASTVAVPDIVAMATKGSNTSCDMQVSHIYGGDCIEIGLSGDMLAASLGMLHKSTTDAESKEHANAEQAATAAPRRRSMPPKEDFAHSLATALIINVAHHATLHASLNGVDSILFSGAICNDPWVCGTLKTFVGRWSKGTATTLVYRNPLYLAAIGSAELADNIQAHNI